MGEILDSSPRQHRGHGYLREGDQDKYQDGYPFHAAIAVARFLNSRIFAIRKPAPTTMNPIPRVTKLSSLSKKRLIASAAIRSNPKFARAMLLVRMPRARMSIPSRSA